MAKREIGRWVIRVARYGLIGGQGILSLWAALRTAVTTIVTTRRTIRERTGVIEMTTTTTTTTTTATTTPLHCGSDQP